MKSTSLLQLAGNLQQGYGILPVLFTRLLRLVHFVSTHACLQYLLLVELSHLQAFETLSVPQL